MQGICAGIIQPAALAAIYGGFPASARGTAVGLFSLATAVAAGIGPWFGGMLVDGFGWRWMFVALAVPSFLAVPLIVIFFPFSRERRTKAPFDWRALFLLAASLAMIFAALDIIADQAGRWVEIVALLAGAVLCLHRFWRNAMQAAEPLIDVRALAHPRILYASVISFLFGASLYGPTFLIPLFVNDVMGMSATDAGLLLLPAGLLLTVGTLVAGYALNTVSLVQMIAFGLIVMAGANLWLSQVGAGYTFVAVAAIVALGRVGLAAAHPAVHLAIIDSGELDLGLTAALTNFTRQLGGAFGVLTLTLVAEWNAPFNPDGFRNAFIASAVMLSLGLVAVAMFARSGK